MKEKIRVALIYKNSYTFLSGKHFDNTTYHFFMSALTRNKKLAVTYFPSNNSFDASHLKGKFDIILLPNNNTDGTPDDLIGIKNLDIPVICRTGDPHSAKRYDQFRFHEKWKINYYFNFIPKSYFYKFYPKNFEYKTIVFGLEPSLYRNITPWKERLNKILNSGATGKSNLISRVANRILNPKRSGWYFYKLRTKCNDLPYVEYIGLSGTKYANDNYVTLLSRYKAAIAATTPFPTIKYLEIPAAGCLTFMEITDKNGGEYLGFKDLKTAVFINEKNYKNRFEEFLEDPNNPQWEQIADSGRKFVLNELNNDKAVDSLIEIMNNLIK